MPSHSYIRHYIRASILAVCVCVICCLALFIFFIFLLSRLVVSSSFILLFIRIITVINVMMKIRSIRNCVSFASFNIHFSWAAGFLFLFLHPGSFVMFFFFQKWDLWWFVGSIPSGFIHLCRWNSFYFLAVFDSSNEDNG